MKKTYLTKFGTIFAVLILGVVLTTINPINANASELNQSDRGVSIEPRADWCCAIGGALGSTVGPGGAIGGCLAGQIICDSWTNPPSAYKLSIDKIIKE